MQDVLPVILASNLDSLSHVNHSLDEMTPCSSRSVFFSSILMSFGLSLFSLTDGGVTFDVVGILSHVLALLLLVVSLAFMSTATPLCLLP